jgi:hypothetical protein
MTVTLASRVRKARKPGWCALCAAPVHVGQGIGYLRSQGWCHVQCVIGLNRATTTKETQ